MMLLPAMVMDLKISLLQVEVKIVLTFLSSAPSIVYSFFKSSRKLTSSYPRLKVISKTSQPEVNAAILDRLCLPDPPTPTNKQLPWNQGNIMNVNPDSMNFRSDREPYTQCCEFLRCLATNL